MIRADPNTLHYAERSIEALERILADVAIGAEFVSISCNSDELAKDCNVCGPGVPADISLAWLHSFMTCIKAGHILTIRKYE